MPAIPQRENQMLKDFCISGMEPALEPYMKI